MSKFEPYNIKLKDLKNPTEVFEYDITDNFFKKIDSPEHEVEKGWVKAKVTVVKKEKIFEMNFEIDGTVLVPCNRCLDEMEIPVNYKEKLKVKFGQSFSEENETVIVPESEGAINIAWFLYEFIVVSIPIKHVHAPGECNKTMVSKLKRHIAHRKDADDDEPDIEFDDDELVDEDIPIDPRWDALQNFTENN
jgi:uncharacterized metal-binding protein YceD (DUF177 family)